MNLDKNTGISIGLALALIGGIIANEYDKSKLREELATVKIQLEVHLNDPSLHHNISKDMRATYITRVEFDSRLISIEKDLKRIDQRTLRILEIVTEGQ